MANRRRVPSKCFLSTLFSQAHMDDHQPYSALRTLQNLSPNKNITTPSLCDKDELLHNSTAYSAPYRVSVIIAMNIIPFRLSFWSRTTQLSQPHRILPFFVKTYTIALCVKKTAEPDYDEHPQKQSKQLTQLMCVNPPLLLQIFSSPPLFGVFFSYY